MGKVTHGLYGHPLYRMWNAMIQRCYNPKQKCYPNYGGRGIRVCNRWRDVRSFIEDIEKELGPRPADYSFDRIDVEGDYAPGNVRWASRSTQGRNTRKRPTASSGYRGVSWYPSLGRWVAQLGKRNDKKIRTHIGYFEDELEAARAYDAAARTEYGHDWPYVNFPKGEG